MPGAAWQHPAPSFQNGLDLAVVARFKVPVMVVAMTVDLAC